MQKQSFRPQKLIWASAALLTVLPAYSATITIGSSMTPSSVLPSGQSVAFTYVPSNGNVTPDGGPFTLGNFGPSTSMNPTLTSSFTLALTDSLDANVLDFDATYTITTPSGTPVVNVTINNGTDVGGYATLDDDGYAFGVQQSFSFDLGKTFALQADVSSATVDTPEPGTYPLVTFGAAGLLGLAWYRRNTRQRSRYCVLTSGI